MYNIDASVTHIIPSSADFSTLIEIRGNNFVDVTSVTIGSLSTNTFTVVDSKTILTNVPNFGRKFVTSKLLVQVISSSRGVGTSFIEVLAPDGNKTMLATIFATSGSVCFVSFGCLMALVWFIIKQKRGAATYENRMKEAINTETEGVVWSPALQQEPETDTAQLNVPQTSD